MSDPCQPAQCPTCGGAIPFSLPAPDPRCPTCSLFLERRLTHTGIVWQCPTVRCGLEPVPLESLDCVDDDRR